MMESDNRRRVFDGGDIEQGYNANGISATTARAWHQYLPASTAM
jgi:hypothetical protein